MMIWLTNYGFYKLRSIFFKNEIIVYLNLNYSMTSRIIVDLSLNYQMTSKIMVDLPLLFCLISLILKFLFYVHDVGIYNGTINVTCPFPFHAHFFIKYSHDYILGCIYNYLQLQTFFFWFLCVTLTWRERM